MQDPGGPPQEQSAAQPEATPPPPADEDSRPATVGDVRSLRRWLIVAGVWAVAASAVGVIALIEAGNAKEQSRTSDVDERITRLQRDLGRNFGNLRDDIEKLPNADDLSKLEQRLERVEDSARKAAADARAARRTADDLDERVTTIEENPPTTSTTPEQSP